MGSGKTSIIIPSLIYNWFKNCNFVFIIIPDNLIKQFYNEIIKYTSIYYDINIILFDDNNVDDSIKEKW